MAARYVTITEAEFDCIFKPERNWAKEYSGNANEVVYTKRLLTKPDILVKIYSSIHKNNGLSRGVGQDAIRICAVNTKTDRGVMKTRRINRVPGWEVRVVERVTEVWNHLVAR
jgi:hypothetical protein